MTFKIGACVRFQHCNPAVNDSHSGMTGVVEKVNDVGAFPTFEVRMTDGKRIIAYADELTRTDLHAVFAVLETVHGPHKVRVSDALDWPDAIDAHNALHMDDRNRWVRPVTNPGFSVYGRAVRYFAVRSITDPDWPGIRPVLSITNALSPAKGHAFQVLS